ncbi:threonine synthase [Natronomonas sp. EA1]|uniref:threonine synthase n=1 Tax=Natronomonas sp. EA1 TaxID=3421655 RepID=UPI003EB9BA36
MDTTAAYEGLTCFDCGGSFADELGRCPDCGGVLDPTYDYDAAIEFSGDGVWRYADLLPFSIDTAVSMGEGDTPLVEAPALAEELGVAEVYIKDDGRNPTGSGADRGQSVAVTAAKDADFDEVALASTGNDGQSATAYAGRAGLDATVFVPSRSSFISKAMINVHNGEMKVVEGRIGDAQAAFRETDGEWVSLGAFDTPFRHDGEKTRYFEIHEQLGGTPDHVVTPVGEGVGLVGLWKGARELEELGLADGLPTLHAAQAEGCAPFVRAYEEGTDEPEPWEYPDTICGGIEIPDPAAPGPVLDAVRESGGTAVATDDEAILDSAVTVAQHEGLEMGVECAAAASGAWALAEAGAFEADDTVVLVNTVAGSKDADVIRSHLMRKGI